MGRFSSRRNKRGRKRRTIARAIPVAGIALVIVTFAFFEYFRSWMFYRMHGEDSFPTFVLNRLAGYYATAINNGAVIVDHMTWPGRLPYDTLESFWSVEGIGIFRAGRESVEWPGNDVALLVIIATWFLLSRLFIAVLRIPCRPATADVAIEEYAK